LVHGINQRSIYLVKPHNFDLITAFELQTLYMQKKQESCVTVGTAVCCKMAARRTPHKLALVATFLTHISGVRGSNLGRNIDYLYREFFPEFLSPFREMAGYYVKLSHNPFNLHHIEFNIHYPAVSTEQKAGCASEPVLMLWSI
jgi:hypothetical protein